MNSKIRALCLATFAWLASSAWAAGFSHPTAEYSADQIMETEGNTITMKVYVARDKERSEMDMGGKAMATIVRQDKKVRWQLITFQKMYMESSIDARGQQMGGADLSQYNIEQTKVGDETIDGVETTKSKIIMSPPDGSKFGGFMWTTKEGIMVKLDAITVSDGEKRRIKIQLKNLKIGKVDPALFELPDGYMKMPGMGGFMSGSMMR